MSHVLLDKRDQRGKARFGVVGTGKLNDNSQGDVSQKRWKALAGIVGGGPPRVKALRLHGFIDKGSLWQ
jgi:hypothetical protein